VSCAWPLTSCAGGADCASGRVGRAPEFAGEDSLIGQPRFGSTQTTLADDSVTILVCRQVFPGLLLTTDPVKYRLIGSKAHQPGICSLPSSGAHCLRRLGVDRINRILLRSSLAERRARSSRLESVAASRALPRTPVSLDSYRDTRHRQRPNIRCMYTT
jgi:hypothetical protein